MKSVTLQTTSRRDGHIFRHGPFVARAGTFFWFTCPPPDSLQYEQDRMELGSRAAGAFSVDRLRRAA